MSTLSPRIRKTIADWPQAAQDHLKAARRIACDMAQSAAIGPLEESLKWGQPAWRPRAPRTGATLRLNWSPSHPDHLMALVDCKTDLASQMSISFPGQFLNDGRRSLSFDLAHPLPGDAFAQLAHLTFTYHRRKTAS